MNLSCFSSFFTSMLQIKIIYLQKIQSHPMKIMYKIDMCSRNKAHITKNETQTTVCYGFTHSPFGDCLIATVSNRICMLYFTKDKNIALNDLKKKWKHAEIKEDTSFIEKISKDIFSLTHSPTIPIYVEGTDFQINVWKCLIDVPFGSLISYEELAEKVGNKKAVRAVATAVANNPIAFFIPCHRIVRKSGETGNYRWGKELKIQLIAWEKEKSS